jgi:cytochrome c peroxidase
MNKRRFTPAILLLLAMNVMLHACKDDPPDIIITKPQEPSPSDTFILKTSSEMPDLLIPADNPLTKNGVALGRFLFYDPILSGNGKQACGDCHNLGRGFTDNQKVLSEGIRGLKGDRNSMPIFNLMWNKKLFWDGSSRTLRQLALMPIKNPVEMDARVPEVVAKLNASVFYRDHFKKAFGTETITDTLLAKALEQFLLTIISDDSKFDRVNRGLDKFTPSEEAGFEIMKQKGCFGCHTGILMHDNDFHNVGLDLAFKDKGKGGFTKIPTEIGKFKTPSLRNVALTGPYMHDGRFASLQEVIKFYDEDVHLDSPNITFDKMEIIRRNRLSDVQKKDILAFLNTLTDQTFLNNAAYKNPF